MCSSTSGGKPQASRAIDGLDVDFRHRPLQGLSALQRRREEVLDDETAGAIADDADDPEVALAKKDKAAVLRQCLELLSVNIGRSSLWSTTSKSRSRRLRESSASRRRR